jgi:hypothetical protein
MANENNTRNAIIRDVTFFWAKINPAKPVSPFGDDRWELDLRFPKARVSEMEAYGKVKPVEGEKNVFYVKLTKPAVKKDGTAAKPVEVVDSKKNPMEVIIGNGSKGNVMVMMRDYEIKAPNGKVTKKGTKTTLTKVQVIELVEYKSNNSDYVDFDEEDGVVAPANTDDSDF